MYGLARGLGRGLRERGGKGAGEGRECGWRGLVFSLQGQESGLCSGAGGACAMRQSARPPSPEPPRRKGGEDGVWVQVRVGVDGHRA